MVRWARDEKFDGGCCADCKPPRLEVGKAEEGEMGEQYRDMCECCEKREDCRAAEACVCGDCTSTDGDREGCCGIKAGSTEKCCTRELKPGRRPTQETASVGEGADSCEDACCGTAPQEVVRAPSPAASNCSCC